MGNEALYIGTKFIKAERMTREQFAEMRGDESSGKPDENGYRVTYFDGYISWSPAETFEACHRKVTEKEKAFILGN